MRADRLPQVKLDHVVPKGGLDLVTPPLLLQPGACRSAENFEVDLEGGYSRIGGYERWAMQRSITKEAIYEVTLTLHAVSGSAIIMPNGVQLRGDTSGAKARLLSKLSDGNVASIRELGSDASDVGPLYVTARFVTLYETISKVVLLYAVTGTFVAGENVSFLAEDGSAIHYGLAPETFAGTTADVRVTVAPTVLAEADPVTLAEELDRAAVAFRGSVLAPWSSESTFSVQTLAIETLRGIPLVFSRAPVSSGTALYALYPNEASEYAQRSDSFGAEGYGWSRAGYDTYTGWGGTTIGGDPEYLECVRYNFSGAADGERLYFTTGNTAAFSFHFIGESLAYEGWRGNFNTIPTGMAVDTPTHVAAHKHRLFLSFGSSLQFSTAGDPEDWSPVTGAGELAVGEDITKLQSVIGGDTSVLLIYTTTRIYGLYGDSSSNFSLVLLASDLRVDPKSIQMFGQPIFLADNGVVFLSATSAFGNFKMKTISNQVSPMLKRLAGKLVSSIVIPEKNQYRLFFSNGEGLYFTFSGDKLVGIMPVRHDRPPEIVHLFHNDATGENEFLFACAASRRVYRSDIGPSFDCRPIDAHLFLAFNASRSARINKAYRRASLEIQAEEGYVTFKAMFDTDYASMSTAPSPQQDVDGTLVNAYSAFDDALWDEFYWDGYRVSPQDLPIDGSGENLSLGLSATSYLVWPFTVSGVTTQYIVRRVKR